MSVRTTAHPAVPARSALPSQPTPPPHPVLPSRPAFGGRTPAVPNPPVRRSGAVLFTQAQRVLAEARKEAGGDERYRLAHLAALRFAAALFAERAQPAGRRARGPVNAWVLLTSVAPELGEWAAFFAAGAATRAALEAGAIDVVSARQADDLVRAVEQFADIVAASVGLLAVPLAS